ncbi:hypothetical protein JCGZ_15693 [Jatropha curcas]|uniref:NAC transcription factor 051 n=1 Tax=Jatropha curcas TaxID=180498 RepID=R4N5Q9_JATCU|nr:NAC transcription factor 25 [Jatropha curcas]AGL39707.1 NAC transcription factor 051 [Jatropha curcas]KDP41286.1 hypothetical protein JCGZ_15693 [Jatropha curcas]
MASESFDSLAALMADLGLDSNPTAGEIRVEEDLNLTIGYRFSPYDYELILYYLLKKILDLPLPLNIITEIDLHQYDPDQLPISEFSYGKPGEAYFFTQRERKYSCNSLSKRTTTTGYWKATGLDVKVFHKKLHIHIGFKKTMVFYWGKAPEGIRSPWIMHEYRLNPFLFPEAQQDDTLKSKIESYVVCRIRDKSDSLDGIERPGQGLDEKNKD